MAPSSRRAWLIWSVGVAAYVVAVLQRTSLGVAGLEAAHRFDASASVLASFAVLQLLVYAGLQVPVGLLLDKHGSRRLIAVGAVLMAAGQLVLALAHSVGVAIVGRVLVGAGDAMTFISVLRLVTFWMPAPRVPVMTQLTGLLGQVGQILSAVPLVALLHGPGWTPAFLSAAATGVLVGVLALAVVKDSPHGATGSAEAPTLRQVGAELVGAWRHPGTRIGFWTHFTAQFSGTVFALLWGFPFLVSGEALEPARASVLLTVFVVAGMVAGPFVGVLVQRHPLRRSWLVLGVVGVAAAAWTVVLTWPGRAPFWLLVGLMLALALGGPGSMIGFDYARTFNPSHRLGAATGIVNVGGFAASLTTMYLIGVLLDLREPGGAADYTLGDFRVAMSVQFLVWGLGAVAIVLTRRKLRRHLADAGVIVPPLREAIQRRRRARR
ncbi:MAG: MFS transporter [Oryzihumus sp.]